MAAAAACLALPAPLPAQPPTSGPEAGGPRPPGVTPTRGPSWVDRRGTSLEVTAMGRIGRWTQRSPLEGAVRPPQGGAELRRLPEPPPGAVTEKFVLGGSDLYRLSCRSCHGPWGTGSPPEIQPVLGAVRATSKELTRRQMEERGRPIPEEMAAELASQARQALLKRLEHGGRNMPVYDHLADDEVEALLHDLGRLAGLPDRQGPGPLVERSVARVGELLVKGTCHICHDATGPGSTPETLRRGILPSLASMPREQEPPYFQRKVREGAAISPGWGRGRMPVFPFLSEDEVAAAYVYLLLYPPAGEPGKAARDRP